MGLLDGKKGLILNIANDRSIATHIATNAIKQGATCGFGFLPMDNIEKSQRRVRKAMEENGFADAWLHPCDVGSDESIETFFAGAFAYHWHNGWNLLEHDDSFFGALERDVHERLSRRRGVAVSVASR